MTYRALSGFGCEKAELDMPKKKNTAFRKVGKKTIKKFIGVILGLISAGVFAFFFNLCYTLGGIEKSIQSLSKDIERLENNQNENSTELKNEINAIKTKNDDLDNTVNLDGGILDRLGDIEEKLNIGVFGTVPESDTTASLDTMISEKETATVGSSLSSSDCIGVDSDGNQHFAGDTIGQTLLLTYSEAGNDVYFLGQFNENYNWDGYCMLNVYNQDGNLVEICESDFSNGNRLNYKSIVTNDFDTWDFADKDCVDDYFIGENIVYTNIESRTKNFTNTNMKIYDMVSVDAFLSKQNAIVLQYYNGRSSGGEYNDNTGEAYIIKYFEPGTFGSNRSGRVIRTFYRGRFVDGELCDDSYNAWYITRSVDTGYMYYKGCFRDNEVNRRDPGKEEFKNPLSFNDVKGLLTEYGYEDYLSGFYFADDYEK